MLVSNSAPAFTATAVMPDGSFGEVSLSDYKGKKVVLFFYPLDFTFVCPTELLAFDHRIPEFEKRGVQVIGVSIDSQFSHHAWRETAVDNGGIGPVKYPLVADLNKSIARSYDVLLGRDENGNGGAVALRGSFLIDEEGIIQHAVVNNLPLGRNVDEMIRMVDALAFHQKNGEVCPAGWKDGDKGMTPSTEGVASYLSENADNL